MASAARPEPGSPALILALLSGILLALSFPRYGHPLFAWIALTPLIVALFARLDTRLGAGRTFLLGFLTGAGYFGGTVYWTGHGGDAVWRVELAGRRDRGGAAGLVPGAFSRPVRALSRMARRERFGLRAILLAPAIWVAHGARSHVFLEWVSLGAARATARRPYSRSRSSRASSECSECRLSSRPWAPLSPISSSRGRRVRLRRWSVSVSLCWVSRSGEIIGLSHDVFVDQGRPVRVALIQGNIPQDQKWDDAQAGQHSEYLPFDDA